MYQVDCCTIHKCFGKSKTELFTTGMVVFALQQFVPLGLKQTRYIDTGTFVSLMGSWRESTLLPLPARTFCWRCQ